MTKRLKMLKCYLCNHIRKNATYHYCALKKRSIADWMDVNCNMFEDQKKELTKINLNSEIMKLLIEIRDILTEIKSK